MGDLSKTGYLDFIYSSDITDYDFDEMLVEIKHFYAGKKVILNHFNEKSLFAQFMHKKYQCECELPCVEILLGGKTVRKPQRCIHCFS